MSKGRILIAAYAFPPGEGGVSMAAYEMAHSLGSRGWDIHVLTRQQDLPEDPSRTRCCPITALPDSLTDDTKRLKEYLDAFLKDIQPDFIVYHSWSAGAGRNCWHAHGKSAFPFFCVPTACPPTSVPISAWTTLLFSA